MRQSKTQNAEYILRPVLNGGGVIVCTSHASWPTLCTFSDGLQQEIALHYGTKFISTHAFPWGMHDLDDMGSSTIL